MNIEYRKCLADPSIKKFPERFRKLHPDFKEKLELASVSDKSVFAYIVFTYDIHSPFVEKYKDWAQRRRETSKACGFIALRGEYNKEIENIILGKNEQVNKFITRYLFIQNDTDFIKLQSYMAMFYSQIMSSMGADTKMTPGDFQKMKGNIDQLSTEIKILQQSVFSGNESKEMLSALYDFVANISYDFKPEDIARKKEGGENIVDDDPYRDYSPETLRLVDDE